MVFSLLYTIGLITSIPAILFLGRRVLDYLYIHSPSKGVLSVPLKRQNGVLPVTLPASDKAISAIAKAPQEERPALVQQLYQPKPDKPMRRTPKGAAAAQYKAIEEISAKMEQPAGHLEQSDILAELEDALRLMISRWNTCLAHNPDHRSACQAGIRRLAEEGVHYLQTMAQDDAGPSYQTGIPQ